MRQINKIILIFVAVFSFAACDSFLDEIPDNRVELSLERSTIESLLASALPDASYYSFAHAMSDNAGDGGKSGTIIQLYEEAYKFIDSNTEGQDTPLFYWISCYEAIAMCNHAIEQIEAVEDDTDKFEEFQDLYGEALVARAYNHFMLLNIYSMHYDPATADTDLGIPYITKPETKVIVKYERSTVAETYKKIEADLEKGLRYIPSERQNPKFHFTKKSAHAFASRLYLFKGEWQKVIDHAKAVIGSDVIGNLRDWTSEYSNLTSTELAARYGSSQENANLLIRTGMSSFGYYGRFQRYGMTKGIQEDIYVKQDLACKGQYEYEFGTYDAPDRMFLYKYYDIFKRTDVNANQGYRYINNILFSFEEVLFNYVEAKVMTEKYTTAINNLDDFFSKRISNGIAEYDPSHNKITNDRVHETFGNGENINPFYPVNTKQKEYLRLLSHARRAEFMMEGIRWFDIKRFNLKVLHRDAERNLYTLTEKDQRKAVQIPQSAIALGMQANPR
ncbi:MAG: RagB/SusD family nutrient uptake outer membrane protein [Marinifilaceae bacterium]|jgi:hypothetical protein|nr:RagB/SusD family nutrient uptake outer membrane protein [Marinifilaceae bacterium]